MLPELDRPMMYDLAMSFWTPWDIAALLGRKPAPRERVEARTSFADQMARCDLRHYLPDDILVKVDRTTMAAGLEGREPLLDHRLVEFALRLPLSMRRGALGTKHLMRKILYATCRASCIERPKQGFAIPLSTWLRGELAPLVDEYLSPARVRAGGLFDPDMVARAGRQLPRRRAGATTASTCRSSGYLHRLRDVARALDGGPTIRAPAICEGARRCACCSSSATWTSAAPRSRSWRSRASSCATATTRRSTR